MNIPDFCVHNDSVIKGFFGDYRFLSNHWPSSVMYAGNLYKTVEHAFVAAKNVEGLIFQETIDAINELSASEVKEYGRKIKLREDWEEVKYNIMCALVFDKFWRHDGTHRAAGNFRQKLLDTGDKFLEETNNWKDVYWGVDISNGGKNNLGKILMKVRAFWQ